MERPQSVIASPSSSSSSNNYEVFLSFRGETRNNFTSHLYEALHQKGIHTFFDDDELERGQAIAAQLPRAIEGSRCAVVILSRDYASSRWCLDELVKIIQCMRDFGQIVLPIFYHVDPSDIRKQSGRIGDLIQKHEQDNPEKVKTWRSALTQVGNLAGYHFHGDRNEAEFIHDFIKEVSSKLVPLLNLSKDLTGMVSRLEELKLCVSKSSFEDVRFIGICGMGGIGKTTLAKAYFEGMSYQFEASSFLENVRESCESQKDGLLKLQIQLLSNTLRGKHEVSHVSAGQVMISERLNRKKVLVVLDDVDHLKQIEGLAKEDAWFGCGSIIILTTRDESLLIKAYEEKAFVIHKVDKLENSEALQLFSRKAFKGDFPPKDYKRLSEEVIEYVGGLPLAIEVLGSFFRGKYLNEWESALNRLKEYPNKEIMEALLISFNGLEETEKNVFLDIACFFNRQHKNYITNVMDSCGFSAEISIRSLLDKSLLHRDLDGTLRMHDLLQEMGRKIALGKLGNEPRRQSRIWDNEGRYHVRITETGLEEVEAVVFNNLFQPEENIWRALSNMKKLRLLIFWSISGSFYWDNWTSSKVFCPDLPNELRYLEWKGFPFQYFPPHGSFGELLLRKSKLWNNPMRPLYNLKYIGLSDSMTLRKLEGFSSFPHLEKLMVNLCVSLKKIHPSIVVLRKLTVLSLRFCDNLESLPASMHGLESLKVLDLCGCSRLGNLPADLGCLSNLEELNVTNTRIKDVSFSFTGLKALKSLYCGATPLRPQVQECALRLKNVLSSIGGKGPSSAGLFSLKKLDLSRCRITDGTIPDDFERLVSLEQLNLNGNNFSCLPACINRLSKLRSLNLYQCEELRSLGPEIPDGVEYVNVEECRSLHTFLDPLSQCNLRCVAFCPGCIKLVDRQGCNRTAITSLGRYIQRPFSPNRRFDIVLQAGDRTIPNWFTHRSQGSSISLPLHPNWCSNEWMGFALCACLPCDALMSGYVCWQIKINDRDWGFGYEWSVERSRSGRGHHLWLLYLPRDAYFHPEWQNKFDGQIEFSVKWNRSPLQYYPDKVVSTICGVRLVYKQEIEELNRTAPLEPLDRPMEISKFS